MLNPVFWLAFVVVFCTLKFVADAFVRLGKRIENRAPSGASTGRVPEGTNEGVVISLAGSSRLEPPSRGVSDFHRSAA